MTEWRPVEIERSSGETVPGLELVGERRIDGDDVDGQPRTVVATSGGESDYIGLVDVAQDNVDNADNPDLVADVLGDRVAEVFDDE